MFAVLRAVSPKILKTPHNQFDRSIGRTTVVTPIADLAIGEGRCGRPGAWDHPQSSAWSRLKP